MLTPHNLPLFYKHDSNGKLILRMLLFILISWIASANNSTVSDDLNRGGKMQSKINKLTNTILIQFMTIS